MRNVKDANGLPFASMLMDIARRGQGTLRYTFLRSSTDPTPLDKVAFTRGFAPWARASRGIASAAADPASRRRRVILIVMVGSSRV